jgi:exoribonuclease R
MIVPGVLVLKNNKTYGRNKGGKLLYKFLPNSKNLTTSYIPYQIKNVGFSKVFINLYVLVDSEKVTLFQTIGPVNILENFYEYQLYCKNLKQSMSKFTNAVRSLADIDCSIVVDRTMRRTFTVDSPGTMDFDDAFGVENNIISVYISNVAFVVDYYNLWQYFSDRISNIYMPNEKIPMIPEKLANICSLKKGKISVVLAIDISMIDGSVEYSMCKIKPVNNFYYDTVGNFEDYEILRKFAQTDKVVEYFMRYVNKSVAKTLLEHRVGIFKTDNNAGLHSEYTRYLSNNYILSDDVSDSPYANITSPIRKMVDLLNLIKIQEIIGMSTSNSLEFYNELIKKLDDINKTTKNIKKVQNDSMLMNIFPSIKDETFKGRVIEKISEYKYKIYLPRLKLACIVNSLVELDNEYDFRLFHFRDENSINNKIRANLI